ncbi:ArsR/SmtB family transcription factor [Haloferula rosea]|uniref:Winged helix-turn-helix transcriptional regulator n=1 Tax=Haloferula rosea TaxID=490093 RepID=A0A934VES0_9BACT|nr:metalloregulator ArsR/SmtB family transcription factor [Haloferula rosea]MBK1826217.1 winged helix-turn-helix transcriptional regulator [Haloferula rosea]
MKLGTEELERVARFFRAFSEPTRLALLQELKSGPKSVGELVEATETTQANVSKQLKMLYETGLLSRKKLGNLSIYAISEPVVLEFCRLACEQLNARPKERKLRF